MSELVSLGKLACEEAMKAGADFADVSVSEGWSLNVDVEKNGISSSNSSQGAGASVRAIYKGATGFSGCSGLVEETIVEAARRATAAAKLAQPDPDFVSIPEPMPHEEVPGLYDPEVEKFGTDQVVALVAGGIDEARAASPLVEVLGGGASVQGGSHALVNSRGIEEFRKGTSIHISFQVMAKKDEDVGSYFDFDFARRLSDFNPQGLGKTIAEKAVSYLGAEKLLTRTMTVVFGPLAAHSLFASLAMAASADSIQRKRSFLVDKRGKRVGSELLTLRDDAYIPGGMGSGAIDGEGSVRKKVTIIEKGIFTNCLHGWYTAHKAGEENTGHGSRGTSVFPTNVVPELGDKRAEEIIAEVQEGIYVDFGSASPDAVTGEISESVDFGFKIEKGKLAYPLKNTLIGINIFDLLANLDAISSDYRMEPGLIMPTIRAHGVRVAGGK